MYALSSGAFVTCKEELFFLVDAMIIIGWLGVSTFSTARRTMKQMS